jgi:CO/xanthine dehydrogenase FAD-binding subunit
MKPAVFEYHAPTSLEGALSLLAQLGDDARPLAGGQSLVPLLSVRLARPAHIVDLNGIDELSFLKAADGQLRIGAMTRQRQLERSSDVKTAWPLLCDAARYIGHVQIRNRGTVGGSLAHAFPSAELPVAMVTLDAEFLLLTATDSRTVAAEEFFLSYMSTVLGPGELLFEIRIPRLPANTETLPWREPQLS